MVSLFFLTGIKKTELEDVWLKKLRFIARGFDIDHYYELKEFKLSLEYKSLYTYTNKSLIPLPFQEEIGIPKLVYEIGDKFPFVASISNKYTSERHSRDDSGLVYSSDSSILPTPARIKHSESMERIRSLSLISPRETKSTILQNTKEHLVQMWLNINEKVSPSRKQLKEQSKERYVPSVSSEQSEEVDLLSEETRFPLDSTHYTQYISGNKKSSLFRNFKTNRKACPQSRTLMYSQSGVPHLPPVPLQSDLSSPREKRVCFSVNVVCHEYPSY